MSERDETIQAGASLQSYGETLIFCCEAQMYRYTLGQRSIVLTFCERCKGASIGPLKTSPIIEPLDRK